MFKIGDFSKLCRVPVSTLRYYADIGLLMPSQVDTFTGYRYYALDQLPRLNRILALRDLGLPLDQIAYVLQNELTAEQLRGMLRLREAEIRQHIADEQARLQQVKIRLQHIEQEGQLLTQDIVVKMIQPQPVLTIRETLPALTRLGWLLSQSLDAVRRNQITLAAP